MALAERRSHAHKDWLFYGCDDPSNSTLELPDCLIASVALRLDVPLVTGNTEDFMTIRNTGVNLSLENWRVA